MGREMETSDKLDPTASRLIAEIDTWHGSRPWASQAAYRSTGSARRLLRWRVGPRAWVAGVAVSGALIAGGVAAAAAAGAGGDHASGFTIPLTQIHVGGPAQDSTSGTDSNAHGRVPAGKTATDKDGHGDLESGLHSTSGKADGKGPGKSDQAPGHQSPSPDTRGHQGDEHSAAGSHAGDAPSPDTLIVGGH